MPYVLTMNKNWLMYNTAKQFTATPDYQVKTKDKQMNCCCNCHRCHAYELKLQPVGKIKHTAILKEPKANCLVYCRLEDVKEK